MESSAYYICEKCGWNSDITIKPQFRCPKCGSALYIDYEINLLNSLRFNEKTAGIWRYSSLLPDFPQKPTLGEGGTFLSNAKRLRSVFGLRNLYIKDERRNPTGAFTDRGAAVVVAATLYYGFKGIWSHVGGNIAASLSAYTAASNLKFFVDFKEKPQLGKLYQVIFFGGEIIDRKTPKVDVYTVTPQDPFLVEGYKTIVFELFEDLRHIDLVIVPMGHGTLAFSLWKGLRELKCTGLLDYIPRIIGVQSSNCQPIVEAFKRGLEEPVECEDGFTIASELLVRRPLRGRDALRALRDTGGYALAVSDREIVNGLKMLAKYEGLLVETASAAAIAALKKLVEEKMVERDENIVVLATGAGLKHPQTLLRILEVRDLEETPLIGRTGLTILELLSRKEMHGYAVWKELVQRRNISKPTVYYHLKRLEELGLIKKMSYPDKKTFTITSKGAKILRKLKFYNY